MELKMSTVDSMLDGDEPIVLRLLQEAGPMTADQFVTEFNNACMQMAGFENFYNTYVTTGFYAPLTNMSYTEH
jgi:hypothetical protein